MGRLSFPSLSCQRAGGGRLAAAPNSFLGVCGIRSSSSNVCWVVADGKKITFFASTGGGGVELHLFTLGAAAAARADSTSLLRLSTVDSRS